MALAGTPGGDSGGLVNISHNQIPIQVCNNTIPLNILGIQLPLNGLAAALGLASPNSTTIANSDTSCHQNTGQANKHFMAARWCDSCGEHEWVADDPGGDSGGLVNVSHNQIPIQACNNTIPVNAVGIQATLNHIAAGLGLLSPGANTLANQNSSCHSNTGQANG